MAVDLVKAMQISSKTGKPLLEVIKSQQAAPVVAPVTKAAPAPVAKAPVSPVSGAMAGAAATTTEPSSGRISLDTVATKSATKAETDAAAKAEADSRARDAAITARNKAAVAAEKDEPDYRTSAENLPSGIKSILAGVNVTDQPLVKTGIVTQGTATPEQLGATVVIPGEKPSEAQAAFIENVTTFEKKEEPHRTEMALEKEYYVGREDTGEAIYTKESPLQVLHDYNPATQDINQQQLYSQLESDFGSELDVASKNIEVATEATKNIPLAEDYLRQLNVAIEDVTKAGEHDDIFLVENGVEVKYSKGEALSKLGSQLGVSRDYLDWKHGSNTSFNRELTAAEYLDWSKTTSEKLPEYQTALKTVSNQKFMLSKYRELGYKVNVTDEGYSFDLPSSTEVYQWKHGEMTGAALSSAAFLESPLAIKTVGSAIQKALTGDQKVGEARIEELSTYALGLDVAIKQGDYAMHVLASPAILEGVVLPVVTLGATSLLSKGFNVAAPRIAAGLGNIGSKFSPEGQAIVGELATGAKTIAEPFVTVGKSIISIGSKLPSTELTRMASGQALNWGAFGVMEGGKLVEVAVKEPEKFGGVLAESAFTWGITTSAMGEGLKNLDIKMPEFKSTPAMTELKEAGSARMELIARKFDYKIATPVKDVLGDVKYAIKEELRIPEMKAGISRTVEKISTGVSDIKTDIRSVRSAFYKEAPYAKDVRAAIKEFKEPGSIAAEQLERKQIAEATLEWHSKIDKGYGLREEMKFGVNKSLKAEQIKLDLEIQRGKEIIPSVTKKPLKSEPQQINLDSKKAVVVKEPYAEYSTYSSKQYVFPEQKTFARPFEKEQFIQPWEKTDIMGKREVLPTKGISKPKEKIDWADTIAIEYRGRVEIEPIEPRIKVEPKDIPTDINKIPVRTSEEFRTIDVGKAKVIPKVERGTKAVKTERGELTDVAVKPEKGWAEYLKEKYKLREETGLNMTPPKKPVLETGKEKVRTPEEGGIIETGVVEARKTTPLKYTKQTKEPIAKENIGKEGTITIVKEPTTVGETKLTKKKEWSGVTENYEYVPSYEKTTVKRPLTEEEAKILNVAESGTRSISDYWSGSVKRIAGITGVSTLGRVGLLDITSVTGEGGAGGREAGGDIVIISKGLTGEIGVLTGKGMTTESGLGTGVRVVPGIVTHEIHDIPPFEEGESKEDILKIGITEQAGGTVLEQRLGLESQSVLEQQLKQRLRYENRTILDVSPTTGKLPGKPFRPIWIPRGRRTGQEEEEVLFGKKKKKKAAAKTRPGRKDILADIISVTRSQARFGKATHPKMSKKVYEEAARTGFRHVPTLELKTKQYTPRVKSNGLRLDSTKLMVGNLKTKVNIKRGKRNAPRKKRWI